MPNENQDPNQLIIFIKVYLWRIVGFIAILILGVLFLTIGFWKTVLILVLCLIGIGLGYIKDCTQQFLNFLNRIS